MEMDSFDVMSDVIFIWDWHEEMKLTLRMSMWKFFGGDLKKVIKAGA